MNNAQTHLFFNHMGKAWVVADCLAWPENPELVPELSQSNISKFVWPLIQEWSFPAGKRYWRV